MKTFWTIVVIILVVVAGYFLLRSDTTEYETVSVGNGTLVVTPQSDGDKFIVDHAELDASGYVAVSSDNGTLFGVSDLLAAGTYDNIIVTRRGPAGSSARSSNVTVSVYEDDGDGTFNAQTDTIATTDDGVELTTTIIVVPDDESDDAMTDDDSDDSDTTTDDETTDDTTDETGAQTVTVTYTDEGFSPSPVTVKVGDTVSFVNNSSHGMWVASAMHPTHIVYSDTALAEHCDDEVDVSFDQCESVGAGSTYSFTFTKAGTWGYHNHVDAGDFGSVVVEE